MITQTQSSSSSRGPAATASNGVDNSGAMDAAVGNANSSNSNGFGGGGGGGSDDMQNKPLPSFQK